MYNYSTNCIKNIIHKAILFKLDFSIFINIDLFILSPKI
jgi:hypothetical protein